MQPFLLLIPCLFGSFSRGNAQRADAQALEVYFYPHAHIAIQYPAIFTSERPGAANLFGEFAVFALNPSRDPYHLGADPCAPLAFAVGTGAGFDRGGDRKHKPQADEYGVVNARGTVTFSEVRRSCIDPNAPDDAILADLAGRPLKEKDITPLARVQYAAIQNNTVWWAAGAGYAKNQKGKRKSSQGLVIFASAAAIVNGHLLVWRMSANSPSAFKRLSEVSVCFAAPACETGYSRIIPFQLNTPPTGRASEQ